MDKDATETVVTEETETETSNVSVDVTPEVETQEDDPAAGLKSALQKERQARKDAEKQAREIQRQLDDLNKTPDEKAIEDARREAIAETMKAANLRVVRTEFRSLAKERGLDPKTASILADLEGIEVNEDGDVDTDSLSAAIDAVISEHPSLIPSRFQGTADQGARGKDAGPTQMSQSDFELIKHDFRAVKKAKDEGRLNKLLGIE